MPYEVHVKLEFATPCLGNERNDDPEPNRMIRSGSGGIIFLQSWWHGCTAAAAERFSMHQQRIRAVKWSAEVEGESTLIDRFYYKGAGTKHIKKHEGFAACATVGVRALVPDDVPLEDFKSILSIAGEFFGISPFGWKKGYGRFKVLEVEQVYGRHTTKDQGEHAGSVSDGSKDNKPLVSDNDVYTERGECDGGEASTAATIPID